MVPNPLRMRSNSPQESQASPPLSSLCHVPMFSHIYLNEVSQDLVYLGDDGSNALAELLVELAVSIVEVVVCLDDLLQERSTNRVVFFRIHVDLLYLQKYTKY